MEDLTRTITIDGGARTGKTTAARNLALVLGWVYLNTGNLYRAVAWLLFQAGFIGNIDADNRDDIDELAADIVGNTNFRLMHEGGRDRLFVGERELGDRELRDPETNRLVSQVAALPRLRAALLPVQRRLAEGLSCIAEGRDCGSVVFRRAQLKLFFTVSEEGLVQRELADLQKRGLLPRDPEAVRAELRERNERDANRDHAPLMKPDDAVVIDTDHLNEDAVLDMIARIARERFKI